MGLTIFFVIMFCSFFCATMLWLSFDWCILCSISQPCFAILYVILWFFLFCFVLFIWYVILWFHTMWTEIWKENYVMGGIWIGTRLLNALVSLSCFALLTIFLDWTLGTGIWETLLILRMSWQSLEWNEEKIYDDIGWWVGTLVHGMKSKFDMKV
jgi:hypothetical protein